MPGSIRVNRTQRIQRPQRRRNTPLATTTALLALLATLAAGGCGGGTESRLADIRALQDAGQYEPSIAPLRKLLAVEAGNPEANYRLGVALVQTGRPSLAVWPLQKASESEPYGVKAGVLLATTLLSNGTNEEAVNAATRVLERDSENMAALYTRAQAQIAAGHPEQTLADADRMLVIRPDDEAATSLRGGALIDLGRSKEAEETWKGLADRAMAGDDENRAARTCAALATFYRSQDDQQKAQETFEQCSAKYPGHALLQQWVSDFYTESAQPEKAIEIWRKAIEETPEDLKLRSKLANLLYQQGEDAEARTVVEESVELFDTPDAWRMLSSFERKNGNAKAAREALEQAMERTRSVSPALRFELADLLVEEGDLERASKEAAKIEEPSYRGLLDGAILLAQGDAKAALAKLDSGLRLWPNNAGARYLAGRAAMQLGNRKRATSEFREAVRVGKDETDAALRLAEIYLAKGLWKPALQFAERQIKDRPYIGPKAHVIATRAATALGQYERAKGFLENLKAVDEDTPVIYTEFALLEERAKGKEAAVEALLKADIDWTDPANALALRTLSDRLFDLGRSDEALARIRSAIEKHPDSPDFYDTLARAELRAGHSDAASKATKRALELNSEFAPALETSGVLERNGGNLDAALSFFERAAKADSARAQTVYLAAQTQLMRGATDAARKALRRALEIDAGHVQASNDLAWLLASEHGDLDEALELAKRAVRHQSDADTLDTLGFVHLQRGETDEAIENLQKALEMRPDSPSLAYRLATALASKGEAGKARKLLQKALAGPAFPEAEAAREELAKLGDS